MSETDDTDELILIPPDLFTVETGLDEQITGPYYNVVDTLISQVNKLENRINSIDGKFISSSLDYQTEKANLMSGDRKYSSSDDINKVWRDGYFESTQSTPQKPKTRFKLSSPQNFERFGSYKYKSLGSSYPCFKSQNERDNPPVEKDENKKEMLQEIDHFLSNLQAQKKEIVVGNGVSVNHKIIRNNSKGSLNLKDLDLMLTEVENQEKVFEKWHKETHKNRKTNLQTKQNVMPEFEYKNKKFYDQTHSTSDLSTCNESFADKNELVSTSSESQITALPNLNFVTAESDKNDDFDLMHKRLEESNFNEEGKSPPRNDSKNVRRNILHNKSDDNTNKLLSLSNLWKQRQRNREYSHNAVSCSQKLEEEKLRRQHCEQQIQQLQLGNLELQERLAVAIQVDEAKDEAILRFHKAWEQVALRLQSLTNERNELERDMQEMQIKITTDLVDAAKKVTHYEDEASKALNLAHANQEKLLSMEKHCGDLTAEIEKLALKLNNIQTDYNVEIDKNKHLCGAMGRKDIELQETKSVLNDARSEISQSKRAVELCQAELTSMKTQYTQLEIVLNEKEDVIRRMEKQNKRLQCDIDSHKKIEKGLQQELNDTKELVDKNKYELRNFYQDQVEIVVRDKLKEFQEQLDKAENSMHEELKKREMTIAKSAAEHIQQIVDKHSLEVKLLEEKHAEEVRLYCLQLSQANQFIESLQQKLQQQQHKKSDIAKQLHKVMEAQWLEALKILNVGKSPILNQDQDVTISQLNVLKSKSHNNLEEVLSQSIDHEEQNKGTDNLKNVPTFKFISNTCESGDFHDYKHMETPLTSRTRNKQQIEDGIQKFVQMLLNKQPGNPLDETVNEPQHDNIVYDQSMWLPVQDDKLFKPGLARDKKFKPPWK